MTDIQPAWHSMSGKPFQFRRPARALYATSRLWDDEVAQPPFLIHEHAAFVLADRPYRIVPYGVFRDSIARLNSLGALQIRPSDLREPVERDWLQQAMDDLGHTYLLHDNVYLRLRRDGYSAPSEDEAVHALMMLGAREAVVSVAELIGLPHPFDDERFPYRGLFHDPRGPSLPVLGGMPEDRAPSPVDQCTP